MPTKWLQGRARPRESQVYDDWAVLLDIGRPGMWIAECDIDSFLDVVSVRYEHDREVLRAHLGPGPVSGTSQEHKAALGGTYACYSHTWSPYFRGRLIRGELSITPAAPASIATYAEVLPTGRLMLDGAASVRDRVVMIDVRERHGHAHVLLCLRLPRSPISLLSGLMCGTTIIGPDAQPSVTRIAAVRLPEPSVRLREADAFLPPNPSVAQDLAALGLKIAEPAAVDRQMMALLTDSGESGIDQPSAANHHALMDLLDRNWLALPK